MFFHFMEKHWLLTLALLIPYSVFATRTALNFHHEVVKLDQQYLNIREPYFLGRYQYRMVLGIWRFLVTALSLVIEFLIAPFLKSPLKKFRADNKAIRDRLEREKRQRRDDEIRAQHEAEAARRAELRKQWFAEHPPVLYYNTVAGITAVVIPEDFEVARCVTKKAVRNGQWGHKVLLMPINNTYLFVNVDGCKAITDVLRSAKRSSANASEIYTGWLSDLDDLVEEHGVKLEQKPEIFVPYVNETILSFLEHLAARPHHSLMSCDLVDRQAPAEMR